LFAGFLDDSMPDPYTGPMNNDTAAATLTITYAEYLALVSLKWACHTLSLGDAADTLAEAGSTFEAGTVRRIAELTDEAIELGPDLSLA
jgi:hypothetical protein